MTDLHGLAVAASMVRLSIWILAVAGVGLLWYGSDRGDRQVSWRAVAGWALIGWGVVAGLLLVGAVRRLVRTASTPVTSDST